MECYKICSNKIRVLAIVFSCLSLLAACTPEETGTISININGGSAGGPYDALIGLFNSRSETLRSTTILTADGEFSNCKNFQEGCPLLSKFEFASKCEGSGGSKRNLTRLGMRSIPAEADFEIIPDCVSPTGSGEPVLKLDNDFALVQNFFVAGAAKTYCPYWVDKFGPDSLYFFEADFKPSFPFVTFNSIVERKPEFPWLTQVNRECDQFFKEQMDGEYEEFEDLRIVLPLYNGLVQFVTAAEDPIDGATATVKLFEDLRCSENPIYLRGINEIYAAEILNRDPRFHDQCDGGNSGMGISNDEHQDWRFDEDLVMGPQDIASLNISEEVRAFITDPELSQSQVGDRMLACNIISAYVISGEIIPQERIDLPEDRGAVCPGNFTRQQLQIPEVVIDAMTIDHPYYQKLPPPAYWPKSHISSMPGLITYLVTTASADPALVSELTAALNEEWNSLMLLQRELAPVRDNILKKPAQFHDGAEQALLELDLLGGGFRLPAFVFVLAVMFSAIIVNHLSRSKLAYDRMGEKRRMGFGSLAWQELLDFFIIIMAWFFIFMVVVTLIRNWDAAIAATQNSDDQISGLTFSRTLLWMFTFISSGYEDNVFPNSTASQIVVSFFAIAGIAYPLFLIAQTWEAIRVKRLNRARGGEFRGLWRMAKDWILDHYPWSYRSKGTLLLCGWNDRAPGLVYTLTCPDSPYEGMINIVANMDTEYPIEFYNFNKSRVRFYRGDASHRSQLERAEANRAGSALILSEHSAGSGKNNSGVLTALAIERLKSEISVFAELSADDGDREFMEQHIDNIVDPKLIARQVLTIGCFDNYVLDFVLDALSPDNHCEWYSLQVSELMARLPNRSEIQTASELSRELQHYGVSVVGVCPNTSVANGSVFEPRFNSELQLDPLKALDSMDRRLDADDYVVCAALDPSTLKFGSIKRRLADKGPRVAFAESSDSILKTLRGSGAVLIIGHKDQADAISAHIKETVFKIAESTATIHTSIVATDALEEEEIDNAIVAKLEEREWSHILLLSSIPHAQSPEEHTRLAIQADSNTILSASFIRTSLLKKGQELPIIVAEVNRTHSRQLAQDAEIDTVVPSSLLIERILARLVSGGGKVSELLCAMLSMKDDVYLRSTKIREGHPLLGKNFSVALNTWYKDGRVLGILPKSAAHGVVSKYQNRSDDFDWHFTMCPPPSESDRKLKEGDIIIVLAVSGSK